MRRATSPATRHNGTHSRARFVGGVVAARVLLSCDGCESGYGARTKLSDDGTATRSLHNPPKNKLGTGTRAPCRHRPWTGWYYAPLKATACHCDVAPMRLRTYLLARQLSWDYLFVGT